MADTILDAVREKYPAYKDVPDDTLTLALGKKYPQYLKQDKDFASNFQKLTFVGPTQPAPPPQGMLSKVGSFLTTPLGPPAAVPSLPEDSTQKLREAEMGEWQQQLEKQNQPKTTAGKIWLGARQGLAALAEGFRSPIGVAAFGIGSLPVTAQRAVSLAFAAQMARESPEIARQLGTEFGKNPEDRDTTKIANLITQGAGTAAFATLAGLHGLKPPTKGIPNALDTENSQLHEGVRPRNEAEGGTQVPAEGNRPEDGQRGSPQEVAKEAQVPLRSEQMKEDAFQTYGEEGRWPKDVKDDIAAQERQEKSTSGKQEIPEAKPQKIEQINLTGLDPEHQKMLEIERGNTDVKVDLATDKEMAGSDDPFAKKMGQTLNQSIATIDRKNNRIVINPKNLSEWLNSIPMNQRQHALRSLIGEERIHLAADDAGATAYWKNLTGLEQAIVKRRYGNVPGMNDTLWGHEALRFRMQQLARMTPREIAEAAGKEKWTLKGLTVLESAVRGIREAMGTKASRESLAILDRVGENLKLAKSVATGSSPGAIDKNVQDRAEKEADELEKQAQMYIESGDVESGNELKAMAKKLRDQTSEQHFPMAGFKHQDYSPEDLERYKQLKKEMIPRSSTHFASEAYQQTWREFEQLRNKYGGMPPKQLQPPEPGSKTDAVVKDRIRAKINREFGGTLSEYEVGKLVAEEYSEWRKMFGGENFPAARPKKRQESIFQDKFILPGEETQRAAGTAMAVPIGGGESREVPASERPTSEELGLPQRPTGAVLEALGVDWMGQVVKTAREAAAAKAQGQQKEVVLPKFKDFVDFMKSKNPALKPGQLSEMWQNMAAKAFEDLPGDQLRELGKSTFSPKQTLGGIERVSKTAEEGGELAGLEAQSRKEGRTSIWDRRIPDKQEANDVIGKYRQAEKNENEVKAELEAARKSPQRTPGEITRLENMRKDATHERVKLKEGYEDAVRGQNWRNRVVSALYRKMVKPQLEVADAKLNRKEVTPDDIRHGAPAAYEDIYKVTAPEMEKMLRDTGGRHVQGTAKFGRASSQAQNVTKRLMVIQNPRSGTVHMVDVYPRGDEIRVLDPISPTREHVTLPSILNRYRPLYTILLDEPVRNFRQDFKNLPDYMRKFGRQAEVDKKEVAGYEPTTIPESEFIGEVGGRISGSEEGHLQGPHKQEVTELGEGELERGERTPLTDAEASALFDHIAEEGDPKNASDVESAIRSLDPSKNRQAFSAVAKLGRAIGHEYPFATPDELVDKLSQRISDAHKNSRTLDEFQKKLMSDEKGGGELPMAAMKKKQEGEFDKASRLIGWKTQVSNPTPGSMQSIGKYGHDEDEKRVLEWVKNGTKPVGGMNWPMKARSQSEGREIIYDKAKKYGLHITELPDELSYATGRYIAYRPGDYKGVQKLIDALENHDGDQIGEALGYTQQEIDEFFDRISRIQAYDREHSEGRPYRGSLESTEPSPARPTQLPVLGQHTGRQLEFPMAALKPKTQAREMEDDLFHVSNQHVADVEKAFKESEKEKVERGSIMPPSSVKKINEALDEEHTLGQTDIKLTPNEAKKKVQYDHMNAENHEMYAALKNLDPDAADPNMLWSRMAKDPNSVFQQYFRDIRRSLIEGWFSHRRTFKALIDSNGNRRVVAIVREGKGHKLVAYDKGKGTDLGSFAWGDVVRRHEKMNEELEPVTKEIEELTKSVNELERTPAREAASKRLINSKKKRLAQLYAERDSIFEKYPIDDLDDKVFIDKNGKQYKIGEATIREVEGNTDTRYYSDPYAVLKQVNLSLRSMLREARWLENFKSSPEFKTIAATRGEPNIPPEWFDFDKRNGGSDTLPFQLRNYIFEPRIRDVLNQFHEQRKMQSAQRLAAMNRFLQGAVFSSNPFLHTPNLAGWWFTTRGALNWINPTAYPRLAKTFTRAFLDVANKSPEYVSMLRAGTPLQYTRMRQFGENIMEMLKTQLDEDPTTAKKIANFLGYATGVKLSRAIGHAATAGLHDVLTMQLIHEAMLRHPGMTRNDAMREVTRIMPDYRVPSRVMGQRSMSRLIRNPNVLWFGAYHYAEGKAFTNLAKGLVKGEGMSRGAALDKIAAIALLSGVAYPILDDILKKVTGRKDLAFRRAGPTTWPTALYDVATGARTPTQVGPSFISLAPSVVIPVSLMYNVALGGKSSPIYNPKAGAMSAAGDIAKYTASQINQGQMFRDLQSGRTDWETVALNLAGIRKDYSSEPGSKVYGWAYSWAQKTGNQKLLQQFNERAMEVYPPSKYAPLKSFLESDNKRKAALEIRKLMASGVTSAELERELKPDTHPLSGLKATETQFFESLTPEQKRVYNEAMAKRGKVYQNYLELVGQ